MISELLDQNIFIKNLSTAKSKDLKSLFVSAFCMYSLSLLYLIIIIKIISSLRRRSDGFGEKDFSVLEKLCNYDIAHCTVYTIQIGHRLSLVATEQCHNLVKSM